MDPMVGMIFMLPFQWAPANYSFCRGQTLSIQQNSALFSLIGTLYGGNGNTDFKLPDLQGRVPLGADAGAVRQQNTSGLASEGGAATSALTHEHLPAHNHTATFTAQTSPQSVTIPAVASTLSVTVDVDTYGAAGESNLPTATSNMLSGIASPNTKFYSSPKTANLVKLANVNTTVTGNAGSSGATVNINSVTGGTVTVENSGGGKPVSLMQPYLAMNFVIALTGFYPPRA